MGDLSHFDTFCHTSLRFAGVDEYCEAAAGVDASTMQLQAGKLSMHIEQLDFDDFIVSRNGASKELSYTGAIAPGWVSVALVVPQKTKVANWCGVTGKTDTLLIATSDWPLKIFVPENWVDYGVVLRADLLESLSGFQFGSGVTEVELSPFAAKLLRDTLESGLFLASAMTATPGAGSEAAALRKVMLAALSGAFAYSSLTSGELVTPVRSVRFSAFSEAVALVDVAGNPFLTAKDLSLNAKIGQRRLQRAFSEVVGISPYQFIMRAKLNAARRDLIIEPETFSIARVAANYGFASASDFAARYRGFFGENPSETRARLI